MAVLQKWKQSKPASSGEPACDIDEQQHYYALRSHKSAINFYRTLPQNMRDSYDDTVRVFRN